MNMDKIIIQLKDVLSEEDLKSFEKDVKSLIEEKVSMQVEIEKQNIEKLAEEYCEMKIEETVKTISEILIKEYDEKLDSLEANIVEKLDRFLDLEITENISEQALKDIAINETYGPIVQGIQQLFERQYVALDTEGHAMLRDYTEKIAELEESLSDSIASKLELEETVDIAAAKLLISRKTEHLTESEKKRVFDFFDGKGLDETQTKLDSFVELIMEKEEAIQPAQISKEIMTEDTGIVSEEELIQEESVNLTKKDEDIDNVYNHVETMLEIANRLV